MLDWLACSLLAPRLTDLADVPTPELPEPWPDDDVGERARRTWAELDALTFEATGPTNPFKLLLGMGCRDLVTREADQQPDTAGRAPAWEKHPAFQPVTIPVDDGPALTGHRSTGAPGAPVVIVVHGLFDSHCASYVVEQAESLRRMGFHVVALDLRDHGQLLGGPHVPSLGMVEGRDLFRAARTLARAEGVSVGLFGMSYGAHCVVRAAHEATVAGEPEVLRGGVLAMCGPLDVHEAINALDDPSRLPRPESFMDRMIFAELLKVMDRHLRLRSRGHKLGKGTAYESYVRQVILPAFPKEPSLVGAYLGKARSAQASVMGALQVPVAVVHPVDDPLVPVVHARRAKQAAGDNPFVHVRELPFGGHVGLAAADGVGMLRLLATVFGRLRDG